MRNEAIRLLMTPLNFAEVTAYIEERIRSFHETRIARIRDLPLKSILKGKNPYLFKAKGTETGDELIRSVLDAFLSSGEETMFGNFLEELAIFINAKVYGGKKAGIAGIDLDFERDGTRYLVSIKSGPVWGNSEAVDRMVQRFNATKRTLLTSGGYKGNIEFVNGCCYGVDDQPLKAKGYYKYCGQRFWSFISGIEDLYELLVVPLGHGSEEWKRQVWDLYERTRTRLIGELEAASLTQADGSVNWSGLVQTTSKATQKPARA